MDYPTNLPFNPKKSTLMHLDLNSCFATIEQQANFHLRGKPIVVAAYTTPSGCILAPSTEAKKLGIKTGMRVKDGKLLCPSLIVLLPDPAKYRYIHLALKKLLSIYTDKITPRSIDEFVLDLGGSPAFSRGMFNVGKEIKKRIKDEIGDWLTVSIGIAPNRFLAKTASNLTKPDGLDEINKDNFLKIYGKLTLRDLCGIDKKNTVRLNSVGINTVLEMYNSDFVKLKSAFHSVLGHYWYLRLRGFEIDDVDFKRKSFGNSYALPRPFSTPQELSPILMKLVEKVGFRLRKAGFHARGIRMSLLYRDFSYWHRDHSLNKALFDSREIYKEAFKILSSAPDRKPVRELAVSCFNLIDNKTFQLEFFNDVEKEKRLTVAVDKINERWGDFVIAPAKMMGMDDLVLDRISFGGVRELVE